MKNYRDLIIWNKSDHLARKVYEITTNWPEKEKYNLTSQVRRAALSIPTNIVEGWARYSDKEFKKFLIIARGSLYETEYLLNFAYDIKYLSHTDLLEIDKNLQENIKLLNKFIKTVKKSIN